jgi:hypothetical protein
MVAEWDKFAIHADMRVVADFEVQVGGLTLHGDSQQVVNMHVLSEFLPEWLESTMLMM